jgi:hypothetical protein
MRFAVPSQFPYLCQKGVWGAYVISQWVHICFLSYLIGFNTILVPPHCPEENKWMHLTVLLQSPYLCQKGIWGAYVISQWVHIYFLSHLISFNTILVPPHCPEENKWMHLTVLLQSPYLCQKGYEVDMLYLGEFPFIVDDLIFSLTLFQCLLDVLRRQKACICSLHRYSISLFLSIFMLFKYIMWTR